MCYIKRTDDVLATLSSSGLGVVYPNSYNCSVKPLRFLGNSLECLRQFPDDARHDAGYQLERVQHGKPATDFKPMPSVGKGVEELRMWDDSGTYRVLYIARFTEAVYVLHAFQKKTRATSERDLELARTRYTELRRGRHG